MTQANKAIKRVWHFIPILDELRYDLNGAKVFSKLDLNKEFHQLELDEDEYWYITTFSRHTGLARFFRLNLRTTSTTEIFHEELRKKLRNIPGVLNIYDDIILGGKDTDDHVRTLKETFQVIKENNLSLNKKKWEFNKSPIKYFGLIFSSDGIYPDPEKVTSLEEAVLKNKDELRWQTLVPCLLKIILLLLQNVENYYINTLIKNHLKI